MKKIYLSLGIIAIVAIGAIGATRAFFSDTETSTGNTFTAGAIDLKIDSQASYNGVAVAGATWQLKDLVPTSDKFFNFDDIKPGDEGENTISIHVLNNDAYVCAAVSNLASDDNGLTEPEGDVDTTAGVGEGELDNEMVWRIWKDDGDNIFENEPILAEGNPENGVLALYDSVTNGGAVLPAGTTGYLGVEWSLPEESGNETQTDSLTADISFYTVQSRNNGEFKCSDWVPSEQEEEPGQKVGAKLSAYVAPSCDATVSGSNSIQSVIDGASINQTICVDSTYDMTGDNTPIRVNKDGLMLAALTRGVNLDVPVVLDNDGTKVTGFDIISGSVLGENAAVYVNNGVDNYGISFNDITGSGVSSRGVLSSIAGTSNGLISMNTFSSLATGVYGNNSSNTVVEYNDFTTNTVGLSHDAGTGNTVRYNEFTGNTLESIGVGGGVIVINYNNILDGNVSNYAASTLNAENNWWNVNGPSDQDNEIPGLIDSTPVAGSAFTHN